MFRHLFLQIMLFLKLYFFRLETQILVIIWGFAYLAAGLDSTDAQSFEKIWLVFVVEKLVFVGMWIHYLATADIGMAFENAEGWELAKKCKSSKYILVLVKKIIQELIRN